MGTRRRGHRAPQDVAVALGRRRGLPGLYDLDPADARLLDDPAAVRDLAAVAGPGADVRLVLDDGEHHLAPAAAIADALGCDVYLTPRGAVVQYVREASPVATDVCDAVAIDRTTREPVPWRIVRPAGSPAGLPTWFTSVRGRLVPGTGVVTVALPDGLAFATRATFRAAATMAARLGEGTGEISVIAVGADLGRFEIGRFNDPGSLLGGVEFATLVAASLDTVCPDVALALSWPTSTSARSALSLELMRLADALDRTVWVPEQGAALGPDLVALDAHGAPARWRAYRSRLSVADPPRCGTDRTGRLVPLRGDGRDRLLPAPAAPPAGHTLAGHAVPGLPAEVVHWPEADQRADTPAYLVLPGAHHAGFVALRRTRPEFAPGQRVLEIKVRRRRLIDVPATVAAHGGTPGGFGAVGGEDLVLPAADVARAVVTKVWRYEDGRAVVNKLDRGTLADHLTPGRRFADPDLEPVPVDEAPRDLDLVGAR